MQQVHGLAETPIVRTQKVDPTEPWLIDPRCRFSKQGYLEILPVIAGMNGQTSVALPK